MPSCPTVRFNDDPLLGGKSIYPPSEFKTDVRYRRVQSLTTTLTPSQTLFSTSAGRKSNSIRRGRADETTRLTPTHLQG
jgi:hypothetical protein